MTLGAKRLRARIAAVLRHERGGRRYGADLKRVVVEYAFARQGEGAIIRVIAGELGLSAGLLGKWLRHARRRLEKGRVPFAPSAPPAIPPLVPHKPAVKPSAAGSFGSHTAPSGAKRGSSSDRSVTRRQVSTPRRIVITATTLAEFLSLALARYGSIRRAAAGIGIPYSTLRGWLRGRYEGRG